MSDANLFNNFVIQHKLQLESAGVPERLWRTLHYKLLNEVFDAGDYFKLNLIKYDDDNDDTETEEARPVFSLSVAHEEGIKAIDSKSIYLIDHACTFHMCGPYFRFELERNVQLADRMCAMMGVDLEDSQRVPKLLKRMWKYVQAYSVQRNDVDFLTDEEILPVWYLLDEVGAAVNHSDNPNFRLIPFLYMAGYTAFSVLFPLRDIECGEHVTRDYVEYVAHDAPERAALLLPWRPADLVGESFVQTEPESEYFLSGHIKESYLIDADQMQEPQITRDEPLKVFAQYDVLRENLTSPCFELTSSSETSDILWLTQHFKDYSKLACTPNKFINQFPFEYVITIKDLLSVICRRAANQHHNLETLATYPSWLPTTYNLKTELVQFVSYYQHRAVQGYDNYWIVKPWNLARGLDTYITNNLNQIVRLPVTGPKIAQKYITNPVLFYRSDMLIQVKFDIRFVVLLKRVSPIEAYIYRKFFLRFANKAYSLDDFDDYQKHFTVMNYRYDANLCHMKCDKFKTHWQSQYPSHEWSIIEDEICQILYEVLVCATKVSSPCAIAPCPQSRALYAADIMLEWTDNDTHIQPKLLEINWTPDCKRACNYYPEFFNDVFKLLFLDESNSEQFKLLNSCY